MKVGITGYNGRLGKVLTDQLQYGKCGVGNASEFDVIVHTLAYTDVDGAEDNIGRCFDSNVVYTDRLRKSTDAKIIYISTDFVFDGLWGPYGEGDEENPLSIYGMSKEIGERILYNTDLIVRTTVLYDSHKPDFVTWVLEEFLREGVVKVSDKILTSPTNVHHLAEALDWLIRNPIPHNIINVASRTPISRYNFARIILSKAGVNPNRVWKSEYSGQAERPVRGGLSTTLAKSLGVPIYSVLEGLDLMRKENPLWKSLL